MTRPARDAAKRVLSVRVVKLGGSLLEWPELAERLRVWLAVQSPAANVLIVGGGALVEKLREMDVAHAFPPEASHLLAIRAMSVTAAVVADLLSESRLVKAIQELKTSELGSVQILDVQNFLDEDQASGDPLPASWDVTSDSIAARVAAVLSAGELVLLKSALPAGTANIEELAASGYVDAYFPRAAQSLLVRCVNLRSDGFAEVMAH